MSHNQGVLRGFAEVLEAAITAALEAGKKKVEVEAPFVGGSSRPAIVVMSRVLKEEFAHLDRVMYTDEYAEGESFTLIISWEGEGE